VNYKKFVKKKNRMETGWNRNQMGFRLLKAETPTSHTGTRWSHHDIQDTS